MKLTKHSLQVLIALTTLVVREPLVGAQSEPATSPSRMAITATYTEENPELAAAVKGVDSLQNLVTDKNAMLLGFKDRDEASKDKVTLGPPFAIYLVDLLALRAYNPSGDDQVTKLLNRMTSTIYPLQTMRREDEGGKLKTRSAVVVSKRKDKVDKATDIWKATYWGLRPLAEDITKYRETVKDFESAFVVWIPALNLHFLGDQFNERLKLIPLADRPAYGLKKGVPLSAKIVFALYAREARGTDYEYDPG